MTFLSVIEVRRVVQQTTVVVSSKLGARVLLLLLVHVLQRLPFLGSFAL